MHFLRFGSSIPGSYWGCCAVDIIQCFKYDPDAKASIELVGGDGGQPLMFPSNDPKGRKGAKFAGPTYKDIFLQRLRIATFNGRDMPNHVFFAVLTASQISSGHGKKWLAILKEQGFEFVRTTDNSVYTGGNTAAKVGGGGASAHKNYIFGLFRNVGAGSVEDTFTPPAAWTELESQYKEPWEYLTENQRKDATEQAFKAHLPMFKKLPKDEWLSEDELVKAGVPITLAGKRSRYPEQLKSERETLLKADKNITQPKTAAFKAAASTTAA